MEKEPVFLKYDESYNNNKLFDLNNKIVNCDNLALQFYNLKEAFKKKGYELSTHDLITNFPVSKGLYFNYQYVSSDNAVEKFLFIWEPIVVQSNLYEITYHAQFKKIFTFCDELVDNKKYFKINYAYSMPKTIPKDFKGKNKLCTLIAGNKSSNHELELYSKRIEAIRWFENFHPEDFDLFGRGWMRFNSEIALFNKIYSRSPSFLKGLFNKFSKPYLSYRGEIEEKVPVLEKYKFAICYENAYGIPGYITEKIFHCFFAGCIPIYWGASNITNYIPKECFIDKRKFSSYESLYAYLTSINEDEYLQYLYHIESFLNSKDAIQFSAKYFADTVVKEVLDEK